MQDLFIKITTVTIALGFFGLLIYLEGFYFPLQESMMENFCSQNGFQKVHFPEKYCYNLEENFVAKKDFHCVNKKCYFTKEVIA